MVLYVVELRVRNSGRRDWSWRGHMVLTFDLTSIPSCQPLARPAMGAPVILNAYARPPAHIKKQYKAFHRLNKSAVYEHPDLLDLGQPSSLPSDVQAFKVLELPANLRMAVKDFLAEYDNCAVPECPAEVYEVTTIPGKYLSSVSAHQLPSEIGRSLRLSQSSAQECAARCS